MTQRPKRPRDTNQLAKHIVDLATGEVEREGQQEISGEEAAAAELGRIGGLKGGKARAKVLSSETRSDIARKAAEARWKKK